MEEKEMEETPGEVEHSNEELGIKQSIQFANFVVCSTAESKCDVVYVENS